jgi:hypothetical protein
MKWLAFLSDAFRRGAYAFQHFRTSSQLLIAALGRHANVLCACAFLLVLLIAATISNSQTNTSGRGVVRLRVRVKEGETTKGLQRKRFFLVKGTLEQNKAWIQTTEQQTSISRDCYYRTAGASEKLINWLKENDCETVYCREIRLDEVEGPNAIPEFQRAVALGMAEQQSREIATKWLNVNLSANLRDGFYRNNQQQLQQLLSAAESVSKASVQSVMTDRNGTAYFTDLEPGTYVITNLVPTETSTSFLHWNCEVQVKAGDIATEKPFLISNRKDRNVKCVGVERPLPTCSATAKR